MSNLPDTGRNVVYYPNLNAARTVLGWAEPLVLRGQVNAYHAAAAGGNGRTIRMLPLRWTSKGRPRAQISGLSPKDINNLLRGLSARI